MKMISTISVIIPVYNVAPYLRDCLDSILAQTVPNWEAICVDDGSTDDSGKILDDYAANDTRIRVFHTENKGVSSARNFGTAQSCGRFIMYLDSDDTLHREAMARLLAIQHETDADMIRYGFETVTSHASAKERPIPSTSGTVSVVDQDNMTSAPGRKTLCGTFSFLSRRLADAVPWPDICNGEDGLFALRCMMASRKSVTTTLRLANYLQREDSATRSPKRRENALKMYAGFVCFCKGITDESLRHPALPRFKSDLRRYTRELLAIWVYPSWNMTETDKKTARNLYFSELASIASDRRIFGIIEASLNAFIFRHRLLSLFAVIFRWPMLSVRAIKRDTVRIRNRIRPTAQTT